MLQQEINPAHLSWSKSSELEFNFCNEDDLQKNFVNESSTHRVSKQFLDLAENVSYHRNPSKWEILYRVLWKLTHGEPLLLKIGLDADLIQCNRMISSIRRDCHKMKAFVRFREIDFDQTEEDNETCFVAWFEPEHFILSRVAPFFKKRFANMHWSILTPDACAHWNKKKL